MNLILLKPDLQQEKPLAIEDPTTINHVQHILRKQPGDLLEVGLLDGPSGWAKITQINSNAIYLDAIQPSPSSVKPLPIKLFIALQRPKMMKRIFRSAAMLGYKQIHVFNAYKVEKSYWLSRFVQEGHWKTPLVDGLQQSRDTLMPEVFWYDRFKPFVEDHFKFLLEDSPAYLAHPYAQSPFPNSIESPASVIIGPEGGFIEFEIDKFVEQGAHPVSLSARTLRTEDTLAAIASRHIDF
tara:strand:- start:58119 stop:58835 length:717 start_codon:yes stop_codon:yes gene_type:complete